MFEGKCGQSGWARTRSGEIVQWFYSAVTCMPVYVVRKDRFCWSVCVDGKSLPATDQYDVMELLPKCTGFDWEECVNYEDLKPGDKFISMNKEFTVTDWLDYDGFYLSVCDGYIAKTFDSSTSIPRSSITRLPPF